ncbi:MAG: HEPN domain-containing protein [Nitrospirota bacterium]
MTEENKIENIKIELDRASKTMDAAILLFDNGFLSDAVSRLYYFLLHIIRALLLSKGFEPKSHEGVLRLFSLHFIKEGIFEPKTSHIFAKLMKYREEADYNPSYVFTEEDFMEFRKEAEGMADKIKDYLTEKGYL